MVRYFLVCTARHTHRPNYSTLVAKFRRNQIHHQYFSRRKTTSFELASFVLSITVFQQAYKPLLHNQYIWILFLPNKHELLALMHHICLANLINAANSWLSLPPFWFLHILMPAKFMVSINKTRARGHSKKRAKTNPIFLCRFSGLNSYFPFPIFKVFTMETEFKSGFRETSMFLGIARWI